MSNAKHGRRSQNAKFAFRPGSRIPKGLDPQRAGESLAEIYQRDGELTASAIVKEATPADSPLHAVFEWRDGVAGNLYRLWQARMLIKNVEVEIVQATNTRRAVTIPEYVHVSRSNGRSSYNRIDDVIKSEEDLAAAMAEIMGKRDALDRMIQMLKSRIDESDFADRGAFITVALESLSACRSALERVM